LPLNWDLRRIKPNSATAPASSKFSE